MDITNKKLEAIKVTGGNGGLLLQLPDHTTHRLQPLNVAVFKPFQTWFILQQLAEDCWEGPVKIWSSMIANTLLPEAYSKAETWNNVAHGFKVAGICSTDSQNTIMWLAKILILN